VNKFPHLLEHCLENLVSAAGLEPATHALKGVAAREIKDLEKLT